MRTIGGASVTAVLHGCCLDEHGEGGGVGTWRGKDVWLSGAGCAGVVGRVEARGSAGGFGCQEGSEAAAMRGTIRHVTVRYCTIRKFKAARSEERVMEQARWQS